MFASRQWSVHHGPSEARECARLQELFRSFARSGAIAAGVPNGADALDGWLNLLRAESPHFKVIYGTTKENGVDVPDDGGWIQNVCLASAEYCVVRAARAFELETAAPVEGVWRQIEDGFVAQTAELDTALKLIQELPGFREARCRVFEETEPILEKLHCTPPPRLCAFDWFDSHARYYADLITEAASRTLYLKVLNGSIFPEARTMLLGLPNLEPLTAESRELVAALEKRLRYWRNEAFARTRPTQTEAKTAPRAVASSQEPNREGSETIKSDGPRSNLLKAREGNDNLTDDAYRAGASEIQNASSDRHSDSPEPKFPSRAEWLKARLAEREWSKHDLQRGGGPEHRTTQKVLDGFDVQLDVLRKVILGLQSKPTHRGRNLPAVSESDIPND
jgi:hypothetical protein